MITINQGDIVWVQYPFADSPEKYKYRPALVISNIRVHQNDHDVILLPVTSKLRNDDFSFMLDSGQLREGALPKTSEVRCHKPATVRSNLVIDNLNKLNTDALERILEKVKSALDTEANRPLFS